MNRANLMVLAAYDANKDGKLAGPERQSACKALASDRIRFPVKRSAHPPPPPHAKEHKQPSHKPRSSKPDRQHNDRSNEAAKESYRREALKRAAAAREASKKKIEEYRRRKEIEKYDKNKDGRLDAEESAALNEHRAEQKSRKEEFYKKYDSNGDGKISSEEKTYTCRS